MLLQLIIASTGTEPISRQAHQNSNKAYFVKAIICAPPNS